MPEHSLHQMHLDDVIQGCQAESIQPRAEERGYCFELFRRALEEREQAAWQAIDDQYKRLILRWICDCSPGLSQQEMEELVPEALPKFWRALTSSAIPLADRFTHIGAVLKYLKQCTISVFRDHERRTWRREQVRQCLETPPQAILTQAETEEELLMRIDQERLLQLIQTWVKTYVTDVQEQRVLSLSYEYGLRPAEIAERYPNEFPDVQTVRRLKERVLKRARRALSDTYHGNLNGNVKSKKAAFKQASVNRNGQPEEVARG